MRAFLLEKYEPTYVGCYEEWLVGIDGKIPLP